jgi:hypothetical protein
MAKKARKVINANIHVSVNINELFGLFVNLNVSVEIDLNKNFTFVDLKVIHIIRDTFLTLF